VKKILIVILISSFALLTIFGGLCLASYHNIKVEPFYSKVYLRIFDKDDYEFDESYECKNAICTGLEKPAIYLYPAQKQDTEVRLIFDGQLAATYPDYDYKIKGWSIVAYPDGKLINKADNREYSYIFWEGIADNSKYDFSTGFIIKGSDTKEFLQSALSKLGLTPKEYNEMIVYWLPKMQNNKYNLIHFAGSEYADRAKLIITPKPDSILRVFMVFRALDEYQNIKPQELPNFDRKGFTVVEWGGTELSY
jgi:hypothetical protein